MEKKTETVVEKVCSGVADFVEYFTVSFLINYFSFTFFFFHSLQSLVVESTIDVVG